MTLLPIIGWGAKRKKKTSLLQIFFINMSLMQYGPVDAVYPDICLKWSFGCVNQQLISWPVWYYLFRYQGTQSDGRKTRKTSCHLTLSHFTSFSLVLSLPSLQFIILRDLLNKKYSIYVNCSSFSLIHFRVIKNATDLKYVDY